MVTRDGAEVRKERISQINKMVHASLYADKTTGYTSLSKVESRVEVEIGLRSDKILEILRLLDKAGYFELDEEKDQIRPNPE
jgi:hypothetical protein